MSLKWHHTFRFWLRQHVPFRRKIWCPHCGSELTLSTQDVTWDLEHNRMTGAWRCRNGHVQEIIGLIEVVPDD